MIGTAWHFLGWTSILIGSAGWSSRRLPRVLSALYLVGGTVSLFVYLLPDIEGTAVALGIVVSVWQGVLLWQAEPGETKVPEIDAKTPNNGVKPA